MQINYDLIGRALIHPVQRRILEMFAEQPGRVSPVAISKYLELPLSNVSYHVGILAGDPKGRYAGTPLLRLVDTAQRRGAIEHFYRLTKKAAA